MGAGVARLMRAPADRLDTGPAEAPLRANDVADRVRHWGFLAHPDLPDGPGPAFLLVALRPAPTLQHYDPEAVDYWVTEGGRGRRRTLTHDAPMPRSEDFSWGLIRLVDRLGVSNEYLTFGGHLDAAAIGEVVVAAFASPAPLLRRGGHSQGLDPGADSIGAFFGRIMALVAVTIAGFALAALSVLGILPVSMWLPAIAVGAASSIGLLIAFFHPWLVLGIGIDLVLLWASVVVDWTPAATGPEL